MIDRLKLSNFQVHESLELEFDPLVTTIVGETDCGKSTIINGIGWVVFNHNSTSYTRHDSDYVYALLETSENRIVRKKGPGANFYRINKGERLRAVGHEVPEVVSNIINLREWNIQWQDEPQFWLHLTPGQVSKELNQIVNLSVIDTTLYNLGSELRKAKAVVEVTEDRLKEAEEKKKEYLWAEDALEDWEKLQAKKKKLDRVKARREELGNLLTKLREAKKKIKPLPDIQPVLDLRDKLEKFVDRRRTLERLLKNLKELKERKCQLKQELQEVINTQPKQKTCLVCGQPIPSQ